MQKEKKTAEFKKNTGTFLVFVAIAKLNTGPSRQKEIIQ